SPSKGESGRGVDPATQIKLPGNRPLSRTCCPGEWRRLSCLRGRDARAPRGAQYSSQFSALDGGVVNSVRISEMLSRRQKPGPALGSAVASMWTSLPGVSSTAGKVSTRFHSLTCSEPQFTLETPFIVTVRFSHGPSPP